MLALDCSTYHTFAMRPQFSLAAAVALTMNNGILGFDHDHVCVFH